MYRNLLAPPGGRYEFLLHSASFTYSQTIQTGCIKLHWGLRQLRRKHLNLFPPSPLTSMYKKKKPTIALGATSWTTAILSKGQDRELRKALSITWHRLCLFNSSSLLLKLRIMNAVVTSANTDRAQQEPSQREEHILQWTAHEQTHTCEPSLPGRVYHKLGWKINLQCPGSPEE